MSKIRCLTVHDTGGSMGALCTREVEVKKKEKKFLPEQLRVGADTTMLPPSGHK